MSEQAIHIKRRFVFKLLLLFGAKDDLLLFMHAFVFSCRMFAGYFMCASCFFCFCYADKRIFRQSILVGSLN